MVILGHPIDTELFRPSKVELKGTALRILSVRHLATDKGCDFLLTSINVLIRAGYDIDWNIIGDGYLQNQL